VLWRAVSQTKSCYSPNIKHFAPPADSAFWHWSFIFWGFCPGLPSGANSKVSPACASFTVRSGTTCLQECSEGYGTSTGSANFRTCTAGSWSGNDATCQREKFLSFLALIRFSFYLFFYFFLSFGDSQQISSRQRCIVPPKSFAHKKVYLWHCEIIVNAACSECFSWIKS